jgi:UDP-glucose 4-epimerase
MTNTPSLSSVLVTGSSGFLGQALVRVLAEGGLRVRGLDVVASQVAGVESVVGSVADPATVDRACAGCDALVISHMAPNRPEVYATAEQPFDINVKGAALLFEAAVKHGVKRVVLISSISVVDGHRAGGKKLTADLSAWPTSTYGLTKTLQEEIALYHHRKSGLPVAMLRPAYVTDADTLTDKYGRRLPSVNWQFIDRRDIAWATLAALRAPGLTFGRYFVHGHPGAVEHMDVERTMKELSWAPVHDFSAYPDDVPA